MQTWGNLKQKLFSFDGEEKCQILFCCNSSYSLFLILDIKNELSSYQSPSGQVTKKKFCFSKSSKCANTELFTAPVFANNVIGYEKTLIVYGSNILKIVAVLVFGDGYFVYWVARYGHIASIWCKLLIEKIATIHCKYSMCADKYFFFWHFFMSQRDWK